MLQVGRGASSMSPDWRACFLISKPRSHLNDCARRPGGLYQTPPHLFNTGPPHVKLVRAPNHHILYRWEHEPLN